LLACWLLSHTHVATAESINIDLLWVCKIYRKNKSLDSVNKLCSKVCAKLCVRTGDSWSSSRKKQLIWGINHEFFKLGLLLYMDEPCLPGFVWLISSSFDEMRRCYPTCHFHVWHINWSSMQGDHWWWVNNTILYLVVNLLHKLWFVNKFCNMEWNGSNDGVELSR
jgi:hypothetical protein